MTTIAYKDGVLAGDGLISDGSSITTFNAEKVKIVDDWLFGACGERWWERSVVNSLKGLVELPLEFKLPEGAEGAAIAVYTPTGVAYIIHNKGTEKPITEPNRGFAVGSGAGFARAAMLAGASATEAVEIAKLLDENTGGVVTSVTMVSNKDEVLAGSIFDEQGYVNESQTIELYDNDKTVFLGV